jgi:hypothetical protein
MKQLNNNVLCNSSQDREPSWCVFCDTYDRCSTCDAWDANDIDCGRCDNDWED